MSHVTRPRICTSCFREVDRPGRAIKCSLCVSIKSSKAKAVYGRTCNWCGKTFTGKSRKYCDAFCRNTANTAAKLEKAGELVPKEKLCVNCGTVKPAYMFNIDRTKRDGLSSSGCRECTAAKHKEWRIKPENATKIRAANLMRAYGLSIEEYDHLVSFQGGCALCGKNPVDGERRLAVDHDHVTGAIRAACCFKCNRNVIGTLSLEDVSKLYKYFTDPPADKAFGERRFVPKGMEKGTQKSKRKKVPSGRTTKGVVQRKET